MVALIDGSAISTANISVVPDKRSADPGPITTGLGLAKARTPISRHNHGLWLWVPAFAGTTVACIARVAAYSAAPALSGTLAPAPYFWSI